MTLPVWISPAAALVTAGVIRLVAPVWSSGPNGEAFTRVLQSAPCARATGQSASRASAVKATATESTLALIGFLPRIRTVDDSEFRRWRIMTGLAGAFNCHLPHG